MPLESAEDLAAYFDTDEHAVTATWSVGNAAVNGIYEAPYFEDLTGAEVAGIESSQPVFRCLAADVAGVKYGQTLTIGGTVYKILTPRPDGTGVIDLPLEET